MAPSDARTRWRFSGQHATRSTSLTPRHHNRPASQQTIMVFPQLSSYLGGTSSQESVTTSQSMGLDSITLGQLKAMVGSAPKPKAGLTSSGTPLTPSHEARESSSPTTTSVMMTRTPFSTKSKNSILMSKCLRWLRISELGRTAFLRVRPRLHIPHQSLVKHAAQNGSRALSHNAKPMWNSF